MKKFLRNLLTIAGLFTFDQHRNFALIGELREYFRDLNLFQRQQKKSPNVFPLGRLRPFLGEKGMDSGIAKGHYFHQDLLVARKIFSRKPKRHLDVGSRIDGFVAHVAAFRPIEVLDIRPLGTQIPNVRFVQCDVMAGIPDSLVEYCDSLSCLHALEHFGLGRYGDPIQFDGHRVGLENLGKLLKPGGILYFSTPIGPQRVEFNAGRVFSSDYLWKLLTPGYRILSFSFVDDQGDLHEDIPVTAELIANNFHCRNGCGIFELEKIGRSKGK
jgi:SAM-dependent methyltransferase